MDMSGLARLGRVAGIGGIALGVVVLLLRPVIEQSASLPAPFHGWLLLTIAIGAFVIGLVGMVLWWLAHRPGAQVARTEGDDSEAHNTDRTKTGGAQYALTGGDRAPAINERGK